MNPLSAFNSQNVYLLLKDYYYKNFQEYGVEGDIGSKLVEYIWVKKDAIPEPELRRDIKRIFDTSNLLKSKPRKEIPIIDLFDLSNVTHFVDIGANNLARINELSRKYPSIENFTAIDVVPQSKPFRDPPKSQYIQIDPNALDYPLESFSCDFINLEFVLHHFKNEKLIKSLIKTMKRILKPGGSVLLWEESFEDSIDVKSVTFENQKMDILTDIKLTTDFYTLTIDQRMEFIKVNDWIINVNIDHMQWTGQWKIWEEWINLFSAEGFKIVEKYNLGLRVNGRLKQDVHMIGRLTI